MRRRGYTAEHSGMQDYEVMWVLWMRNSVKKSDSTGNRGPARHLTMLGGENNINESNNFSINKFGKNHGKRCYLR